MKGLRTALLASFLLWVPVSHWGQGPVLTIVETEHDFGDVFTGEELTHVFRVRNDGSGPLEMLARGQPGGAPPLLAAAGFGVANAMAAWRAPT